METWKLIDTKNVVYTSTWDDAKSTVKAVTFGAMVELSKDRVKHYVSDLWHDALWVNEVIQGPMSFDWVARESGTFIGESVKHIKLSDWPDAVKYRLEIVNERDKYVLNIYEAVFEDTASKDQLELVLVPPGYGLTPDEGVAPLELNDSSDGTFTEDDQGNWHPVELKEGTEVFKPSFPTLGNIENEVPLRTGRRVRNMDSILNELRDKLEEANNAKEELENTKYDLDNAIEELETYIADVDDLLDKLDSLPEVSVYFEANISFDS